MTGNPAHILIVEDDDDHAELMLRSLRKYRVGNHIDRVADGEQALDYLFRRGEFSEPETSPRPDVVFLDLRLPKIDGIEVLRQIKESEDLRRIPVVIVTTSEAEIDLARAYDLHANSYVVKPVDFDKFFALMQDLGFYWLVWNRSGPDGPPGGGAFGERPGDKS